MNQTKIEAGFRLTKARGGSLTSNPSLDYLEALKSGVADWLENINFEINSTKARENNLKKEV